MGLKMGVVVQEALNYTILYLPSLGWRHRGIGRARQTVAIAARVDETTTLYDMILLQGRELASIQTGCWIVLPQCILNIFECVMV